ncbi:MAG TPA: AbfB domain-containing protein [Gemmatimonadaceae bacterium]|nr:AbfB domain-containing protein [Gemmatimonadaceae bacterium]
MSVMRKWFVSVVVMVSTALPLLSRSSDAQAPKEISFESFNFPGRYIRHRQMLGYVEKLSDALARKDATFKIVPGLAGKCRSFESVNYPNHFLRHENFRLKLARRSNDRAFLEDATFCFVPGLASSTWYSFESVNLPRHYIRHSNFELWLGRFEESKTFREDATFRTASPGGGVRID